MTLPISARNLLVVCSVDGDATRRMAYALASLSGGIMLSPWDLSVDLKSEISETSAAPPEVDKAQTPFDAYLQREQILATRLRKDAYDIVSGFLANALKDAPKDVLVFVALPSSCVFELGAHPETGIPSVLEVFEALGVSILHLVRRDPLQLGIEDLRLRSIRRGLTSSKIRLEPPEVFKQARWVQAQQGMLSRYVSALDAPCLRVVHEEMHGDYSAINLRRIFRLMGSLIPVDQSFGLPLRKDTPSKSVVNMEEILDTALREAPDLIPGLPHDV